MQTHNGKCLPWVTQRQWRLIQQVVFNVLQTQRQISLTEHYNWQHHQASNGHSSRTRNTKAANSLYTCFFINDRLQRNEFHTDMSAITDQLV